MKPKVFIGSSTKSLPIAKAIKQLLEDENSINATVWRHGVFDLSTYNLESLIKALDEFQYGVFVFAPDDVISTGNEEYKVARDNVVFELGLFTGKLGIRRNFIIMPANKRDFHLPTDLLGLMVATYDADRIKERSKANLLDAFGAACNEIQRSIETLEADNIEAGNRLSRIVEHQRIHYGNIVILRHVATQKILHSQHKNFTHPGTSNQQQITCHHRIDTYGYWTVKGRHGQAQSEVDGQDLRCGSIIRLEHLNTRTNLHSHSNSRSPVTSQQEVTGFGTDGNGDDNWEIVEISAGMDVWTTGNAIKLRHQNTGRYLYSQAEMSPPEYTDGQQEVTCSEDRNNNEWWEAIIVRR